MGSNFNSSSYIITINLIIFILLNVIVNTTCKLQYNVKEQEALKKIRPLVDNIVKHEYQKIDSYLIRYLKVKNLNVKAAVELLQEAEKWRADNMVETRVNITNIPDLPKILFTNDGVDKEGRVVYTASVGDVDLRSIVLGENQWIHKKLIQHFNDRIVTRASETVLNSNGTLTDSRLVNIIDFKGFSLHKHACLACLGFFNADITNIDKYYPGSAALTIIINTPRAALSALQLIINLFSPETRATIKTFGTDKKEWSNYIHKIISPNQLTQQFSGTRKNEETKIFKYVL